MGWLGVFTLPVPPDESTLNSTVRCIAFVGDTTLLVGQVHSSGVPFLFEVFGCRLVLFLTAAGLIGSLADW